VVERCWRASPGMKLLEIRDLVNRAVAEGAELPEGQIVQLGVSSSPMEPRR